MGVEKEENFGLNWMETEWRGYDAALGRFHGVDAMASSLALISPYQYSFNNPTNLTDPTGLKPQYSYDWDTGTYKQIKKNGKEKEVSWEKVRQQVSSEGGDNLNNDAIVSVSNKTGFFAQRGRYIVRGSFNSGKNTTAEPGEGALVPKSFNFQKVTSNWQVAGVTNLRLIFEERDRFTGLIPIRYNHVDFNITVGVPVKLKRQPGEREGRVITAQYAALKAAFAANMAAFDIGLDVLLNKNLPFTPQANTYFPKRFAYWMQTEMGLDHERLWDDKLEGIPGARVRVGLWSSVPPTEAIYENRWDQFSNWISDFLSDN